MTQVHLPSLLKLIEASEALDETKKTELKNKLGSLSPVRLAELHNLLVSEQKFNADHYRKIGQIKTHAAEKKIKIVYNYAEKRLNLEEAKDLNALEDQLANLEA